VIFKRIKKVLLSEKQNKNRYQIYAILQQTARDSPTALLKKMEIRFLQTACQISFSYIFKILHNLPARIIIKK
jgi:hypothetical protein